MRVPTSGLAPAETDGAGSSVAAPAREMNVEGGEGAPVADPGAGHTGGEHAGRDGSAGGALGGGAGSAASVPAAAGPSEFPIVSFTVVWDGSEASTPKRRPVVHACLGRSVYMLWAKTGDGAPTSVDSFRSQHQWRVRLERGAAVLRRAQPGDSATAGVDHNERLLLLRGKKRSSTPGIEALSLVTLLLEAPSSAVADAWAAAGQALLCPWPSLLSPLVSGGGDPVSAVRELEASLRSRFVRPGRVVPGAGAMELGTRWRRSLRVAAHWLSSPSTTTTAGVAATTMKMADAADQASAVPVVGAALCLALCAAQVGALFLLASEHAAIRAAVTDKCIDVLTAALRCTAKALSRPQTQLVDAHAQQLSGVLERAEAVLGNVEGTYFDGSVKDALQDAVVRGWGADLEALHERLLDLIKEGEHAYEMTDGLNQLGEQVSDLRRSVGRAEAPGVEELEARLDVRAPDLGYVAGVSTPDRVEHALLGALQAYVRGGARKAPRLGVLGIGGSGKSTACAGVATCEEVHSMFSQGSVWVQLGDAASKQTLVDAVVGLTARFCGRDTARKLLSIPQEADIVGIAAGYVQSVSTAADTSAQWLVVIDDVLSTTSDMLRQLLRVVPPATPVLFTTRTEAVVSAVDCTSVPVDGLPHHDARLLLASAMSKQVTPGVAPFSSLEETEWVGPVVDKTERHALSLRIVGAMIGRRGAWRRVLDALEERWMEADFVPPGGSLGLRSSVRATLDTSLRLLPSETSRTAFRSLGVLPASVEVGVGVLMRLWRPLLGINANADAAVTDHLMGANAGSASLWHGTDALVDALIGAGLLRSVVRGGEVAAIVLHPVVVGYAKRLLAADCPATHSRLLDDYICSTGGGEMVGGVRLYKLEGLPNDGYIFDHVARHAVASGDLGVLVSLTQLGWQAVRVRACSPWAYQQDLEIVVAALLAVTGDLEHEVHQLPEALAGVRVSLGCAFLDRVGGSRATNVEAAVECFQLALQMRSREVAPREWAMTQANLGIAFHNRVVGDRASNVEAAIECHRLALQVQTREAEPQDWAMNQNNLGVVLTNRDVGDKAANVEAAVECHLLALQVRTREAVPRAWAATQSNLGNAYMDRVVGDWAVNVEAAVECYQLALQVQTREGAPRDWAATQHNLGTAYMNRVRGDKGANVEAAVECYRLALQVRTREAAPRDWAATQSNLGNAYMDRVVGDLSANVEAAVECYHLALEVQTREAAPRDWAATNGNLGTAYMNRVAVDWAFNVEAAIECYQLALKVRTREAAPREWAATQSNLGNAFLDRVVGNKAANVEAAVDCYRLALQVRTREAAPRDWAVTQSNLGNAFMDRVGGSWAANVESAIECYQLALEVRTREAAPRDWALTQSNLGIAHSNRVVGDRAANIEAAVACYLLALQVRTREAAPRDWAMTQTHLGVVYVNRVGGDTSTDVEAAVDCHRQALQVLTRQAAPREWAMTQDNLGLAYMVRVIGEKAANVEAAVECYLRALQVRTREAAPLDWATTQTNLGVALMNRMGGDKAASVEAAVDCHRLALQVQTREAAPRDWATTLSNLGDTHMIRVLGGKAANVETAVECYQLALQVRTREAAPLDWAATQHSLGVAYVDREGGDWATNVAAAVECHRRSLGVYTSSAHPGEWLRASLALLECLLRAKQWDAARQTAECIARSESVRTTEQDARLSRAESYLRAKGVPR